MSDHPAIVYLRAKFPDVDDALRDELAKDPAIVNAADALDDAIAGVMAARETAADAHEPELDAQVEASPVVVEQDATAPAIPLEPTDTPESGAPPSLAKSTGSSPSAPTTVVSKGSIRFALRNVRQGECLELPITTLPEGQPFEAVEVRVPADLGIEWSRERQLLIGTPIANGEFKLHVVYRIPGIEGSRSEPVDLLVNPDPRLLWKDLPSDDTAPFWKEDRAQCLVDGPGRRIVAARQRGRSHAHVGSFCEDDFSVACLPNGWYITIVADGAGSAKFSRLGSKLACEAAMQRLQALLAGEAGDDVLAAAAGLAAAEESGRAALEKRLADALYMTVGHAAHAAMKAIQDAVDRESEVETLRELATTLLIGITHEVEGKHLCASFWVGDGAVGVYRADPCRVDVLGEVDSGEYSGQTRFLDASEVKPEALVRRIRYVIVDDFTAFVLMTDGVSDAKFETESRLMQPASWSALWADLESAVQLSARDDQVEHRLQEWLGFWSQGNHDDRTISILY